MKAFKNRMVRGGMWIAAGTAIVALILLYLVIVLAGFSVVSMVFYAYLWCLWNYTGLTMAIGMTVLPLVFLATNTKLFDGIFKG